MTLTITRYCRWCDNEVVTDDVFCEECIDVLTQGIVAHKQKQEQKHFRALGINGRKCKCLNTNGC